MSTPKKLKYVEPDAYFPKSIRDKILNLDAKSKTKKKSEGKGTKKK